MDLAFVRAAFSPVIAEALDRSDGIYHRDDGRADRPGRARPAGVRRHDAVLDPGGDRARARREDPARRGDVFIVNDPVPRRHAPDGRQVRQAVLLPRASCGAGSPTPATGPTPAAWCRAASRPTPPRSSRRACACRRSSSSRQGRLDEEILAIILSNIRIADQRIGDIKAQAAALAIGERRLDRAARPLRRGHRRRRDRRAARAARARQMRAKIAAIPDGAYEGEAFVDSDGVVDEPLRIAMRDHQARHDDARLRHVGLVAAVPRADEQRDRDHQVLDLPRGQARLPGSADQRRHVRAAAIVDPRARSSTRSTRGRSRAAPPRSASGSPKRCSARWCRRSPTSCSRRPPGRRATSRSAASIPVRQRSYVMYVISGGGYGGSVHGDGLSNGCSTIGISKTTPDRGDGAALSRCCSRSTRCTRARAAPASTAAASASTTAFACAAATARASHGHGPRPRRPAGRAAAARTAASTGSDRRTDGVRLRRRRTSRRTRTSSSTPAT